jgi:hypothetical protein
VEGIVTDQGDGWWLVGKVVDAIAHVEQEVFCQPSAQQLALGNAFVVAFLAHAKVRSAVEGVAVRVPLAGHRRPAEIVDALRGARCAPQAGTVGI